MSTVSAIGAFSADPASLQDVRISRPALLPHDLLVEVQAVSVNPVDVKVRKNLPPQTEPRILGFDAAGTVVEVGQLAEGFAVGDEVWYAGDITRPGSNAQLQAVDSRVVAHKPTSLDWAAAAAVPLTALTAWESLFDRMRLQATSTGTLLVMAGAGGVGSSAIQLARELTGVQVLATASRSESSTWCLALGAHATVDHADLVVRVLEIAPAGVDWVLSPTTAGNIEAYAQIIKPFGAVTVLDEPADLNVAPLKARSIAWLWESMFTRTRFHTPDLAEQGRILAQLAEMVDAGRYRSPVTTVINDFSANGLREGHRLIETGRTIGKIVVAR